jgi:oligopeptide/dipeptide ABC transporter ATP-binding protein
LQAATADAAAHARCSIMSGCQATITRACRPAFRAGSASASRSRALAVAPKLLVADEPVSALDVSVQAGILTLLRALREEHRLAMLFISHDLSVVEAMADRVMVLYLGRVMEVGPVRAIFTGPRHPYTTALLSAAPGRALAHRLPPLAGEIPSPADPPSGCVFRTRCPFALAACAETVPPLRAISPGHARACIRDDLAL